MTSGANAPARYRPVRPGLHPPNDSPEYHSTQLRCPQQPLVSIPQTLSEITGPVVHGRIGPLDHDLTRQHAGAPLGERIIVEGRVLDEDGRPRAGDAGGAVAVPTRPAATRIAATRTTRRWIRTSRARAAPSPTPRAGTGSSRSSPAPIRGGTIRNAWRPAHIHFSVFGSSFLTRLVTQMFFPGDPLLPFDPIFNSVPEGARGRLVAVLRLRPHQSRSGRSGIASTSCCAAARPRRWRPEGARSHAVPDRRAVLPSRPALRGRRDPRPPRARGRKRIVIEGTVRDGAGGAGGAMCSSRPGRPTPADATITPRIASPSPWTTGSTASAACRRPITAAS